MKHVKKITYNAPVVLSFAIISALALLLNYVTNGWANRYLFSAYRGSILDPILFILRLFTHVLGHANLSHYTNNMLLFLLLGPLLEEKYGSKRLLTIILTTAFVTGLIHVIINPNVMLLGASGIVFAFILLASITGEGEGIPLTLIVVAIIYIGDQVYAGFTSTDNISQLTHIIGGICGAAYGMILKPKKKSY